MLKLRKRLASSRDGGRGRAEKMASRAIGVRISRPTASTRNAASSNVEVVRPAPAFTKTSKSSPRFARPRCMARLSQLRNARAPDRNRAASKAREAAKAFGRLSGLIRNEISSRATPARPAARSRRFASGASPYLDAPRTCRRPSLCRISRQHHLIHRDFRRADSPGS